MKTVALIISVVMIPVIFAGLIINQIAQKVECEGEVLRPATVRKIYLDWR